MSEMETDSETECTFASTPWNAEPSGEIVDARVWGSDGDLVAVVCENLAKEETSFDRARLIAAAGTAAHDLPDEYDPVAVQRHLPGLLEAVDAIFRYEGKYPTSVSEAIRDLAEDSGDELSEHVITGLLDELQSTLQKMRRDE